MIDDNVFFLPFVGYPLLNPGHYCAIMNGAVMYAWQSSTCTKKLGYICYVEGVTSHPTDGRWKRCQCSIAVSLLCFMRYC